MNPKIKSILTRIDPFILIMLGLVLLASFFPVRGNYAVVADWLKNIAIFFLFFLHGAKLSRESIIAGFTSWKIHAITFAFTFILFPIIGLGVKAGFSGIVAPALLSGFLFLCLLPSTVQSSIAFTSIAGGNVPAAVCGASLSNLLGIFITPLLVGLFMGQTAQISMDSIEKIALQLFLPFILGHLSRPLIGKFIDNHKTIIGKVDRTSILLVVYTAFSASVVDGLWRKVGVLDIVELFILSSAVLAFVLYATWHVSGMFGLSREDKIVVLFCGSKKSMASGIPMASTLFPASVLGPVILPLMLFHQLQLIICAFIAQNMRNNTETPEY